MRQLREQLAAKVAEVPAAETTMTTPDVDVPKELSLRTQPPVTVAPPDILRIEAKSEGKSSLAPVRGEHLIRPDGTVGLGQYGSVNVADMTIPMVKAALTEHLKMYIPDVRVAVDVSAFNSRWFYVVTDVTGREHVVRVPCSGNETVLDAVAQIGGITPDIFRKVWIARPGIGGADQVLPVDWKGITENGQTRTNYQILTGDRVFVMKASGP